MVRALAFHQCSQGSIFTLGVICGLSLLVVMRGFSPGTPFSPLIKYQHLTFDLILFLNNNCKIVIWAMLI